MIHWAWIILAFYSGGIMMLLLSALFQANGNPTPEDDNEQAIPSRQKAQSEIGGTMIWVFAANIFTISATFVILLVMVAVSRPPLASPPP